MTRTRHTDGRVRCAGPLCCAGPLRRARPLRRAGAVRPARALPRPGSLRPAGSVCAAGPPAPAGSADRPRPVRAAGSADRSRPACPRSAAVTDPYATRPHRVQAPPEPGPPYVPQDSPGGQAYGQPAYPADEPYGGGPGRHGSRPAPPGRATRTATGGGLLRPADRGPRARTATGRPGRCDAPAGRGNQNGYGAVGYPQPDDEPFRWRPSPETPEPEDLAPLPGLRGGTDREPRPGQRDWDPGQERDWDRARTTARSAWPSRSPARSMAERGSARRTRLISEASGTSAISGVTGMTLRRAAGSSPGSGTARVPAGQGRAAPAPGRPGAGPAARAGAARGARPRAVTTSTRTSSPGLHRPGNRDVTVQVLPGDTATSLAPRLVKLGVVASASSFISAAKDSSDPDGPGARLLPACTST